MAGFEHRAALEIVHRSFQLDPASPKGEVHNHRDRLMFKYGMSRSQADATQIKMEQTAADEGLEFHLVGGTTGNTLDAHRLLHLARERGMQAALLERLYRAHFTEQRSVFDPESLAALAAEVGLDAEEAAVMMRGDVYADAVAADLREARGHAIGGVPHYLFDGRHGVSQGSSETEFVESGHCGLGILLPFVFRRRYVANVATPTPTRGPPGALLHEDLRVGRFGPSFSSPQEPHCRDEVEDPPHV